MAKGHCMCGREFYLVKGHLPSHKIPRSGGLECAGSGTLPMRPMMSMPGRQGIHDPIAPKKRKNNTSKKGGWKRPEIFHQHLEGRAQFDFDKSRIVLSGKVLSSRTPSEHFALYLEVPKGDTRFPVDGSYNGIDLSFSENSEINGYEVSGGGENYRYAGTLTPMDGEESISTIGKLVLFKTYTNSINISNHSTVIVGKSESFRSPFWQPDKSSKRDKFVTTILKILLVAGIIKMRNMFVTPTAHKIGLIGSCAFVFIETFWISLTSGFKELGHSSFAQWWANAIFLPFSLVHYRSTISSPILRVLFFPLNIWMLEIVEGYLLMLLFTRNIAWEYKGKHALFHGTITSNYFLPWAFLGLVVEFLHGHVDFESLVGSGGVLEIVGDIRLLSAVAVLTAILAPTLNPSTLARYLTQNK